MNDKQGSEERNNEGSYFEIFLLGMPSFFDKLKKGMGVEEETIKKNFNTEETEEQIEEPITKKASLSTIKKRSSKKNTVSSKKPRLARAKKTAKKDQVIAKKLTEEGPIEIEAKTEILEPSFVSTSFENEEKRLIKYISVGEKIDDLQKFDPVTFVEAIFDIEDSK